MFGRKAKEEESRPRFQAAPMPVGRADGTDLFDHLQQLSDRHRQGELNDEEYAAAKDRLFGES